MTEAAFQNSIVAAAQAAGWLVYHTHNSQRSQPGFPDLVLVHPEHGLRFAECKAVNGILRPEQVVWHEALAEAGLTVRLFVPGGEPEIERCLRLEPGSLGGATSPQEASETARLGNGATTASKAHHAAVSARARQLREEGHGERAAQRIAAAEAQQAAQRERQGGG